MKSGRNGRCLVALRVPGLIGPSAISNEPLPLRSVTSSFQARGSTWEKTGTTRRTVSAIIPRKEVIQPHLPVRLPCYDFVPVASPTFDGCLLAVGPPASGVTNSHDVTGGVYKAREHIHRSVLTCGY